MMGNRAASGGFTLIEMMIVVVVIAILATIAMPAYQEYVAQARRAEAAAALLEGAQALERYYSTNGGYVDDDGALAAVFPTQVPASGTAYYTIASAAAGENTFRLRATRTGIMAGDECGNFDITQTGARELNDNDAARTVAECWRR